MLNDVAVDWSVLSFAFGVSLAAGALFGLAPAVQVRRLDVTHVLKLEGRGTTASREQHRTRRLLVIGELALSFVLMISAGLLLRSFWDLLNAPLGFDPRNVTLVRTCLPYPNDPKEDLYGTVAAEAPFVREVIRRARAVAGVEEAALGSGAAVPLDHPEQNQNVLRVVFEGGGRAPHGEQPTFVTGSQVTSGYFHLLGLTLLSGRLLNDFDTDNVVPRSTGGEGMNCSSSQQINAAPPEKKGMEHDSINNRGPTSARDLTPVPGASSPCCLLRPGVCLDVGAVAAVCALTGRGSGSDSLDHPR